jgi:hypothetical protein
MTDTLSRICSETEDSRVSCSDIKAAYKKPAAFVLGPNHTHTNNT